MSAGVDSTTWLFATRSKYLFVFSRLVAVYFQILRFLLSRRERALKERMRVREKERESERVRKRERERARARERESERVRKRERERERGRE